MAAGRVREQCVNCGLPRAMALDDSPAAEFCWWTIEGCKRHQERKALEENARLRSQLTLLTAARDEMERLANGHMKRIAAMEDVVRAARQRFEGSQHSFMCRWDGESEESNRTCGQYALSTALAALEGGE